jgi:hypothetical protein
MQNNQVLCLGSFDTARDDIGEESVALPQLGLVVQ